MADKYQDLLIEWCDALVASEITDERNEYFGGFHCDSCSFPHGRADNAIYPLVCAYALSGQTKYLAAAEKLLIFREKLTLPTGAVFNDFTSAWEGITAFSAIGLLKTLLYFGDKLPAHLKDKIEKAANASARWVHEKMVVGFPAYINYYCAAALVNALYAVYRHEESYAASARALLDYCMTLFTANGLLAGEGKPHDDKSPKGCPPIDIGYIAEESMPCLIHAASLLGEEEISARLTDYALKQLDFFLPDGGWDNSFGVRNNKWTYYGSRTSDGCIGAFAELSKRNILFGEAAERTYSLLRKCTHDGLLYGGMHYYEMGQKPCVHHTFCHAAALADAVHAGISASSKSLVLPSEEESLRYKYYPELDTYKIQAGHYLATLTGYDYATHHFANGAAHATGGTLSLLYKHGTGPLIAGSIYDYKQTEPNNMQAPTGERKHATLIVRAEYEKDGVRYATCLDRSAEINVAEEEGTITAYVRAGFLSVQGTEGESGLVAEFRYRFAADGVTITVGKLRENIRFVLPLTEGAGTLFTKNSYAEEPVFFLAGGFAAKEYAFSLGEEVTVKII